MRRKRHRESQIAWIGEIWKLRDDTILVVRFWENYKVESGLWQAKPSNHCQTLSVDTVDYTCEGHQDGKTFITKNAEGHQVKLDLNRARYYKFEQLKSRRKKVDR